MFGIWSRFVLMWGIKSDYDAQFMQVHNLRVNCLIAVIGKLY